MRKILSIILAAAMLCGMCIVGAGADIIGTSTILGDADGDGFISLKDVSLVLRHIAGWDVQCLESNADVDLNGTVNLTDVSKLLWKVVYWGQDAFLPAE